MSMKVFKDRIRFTCVLLLNYLVFTSVLAANENDFYIVLLRDHPMNERFTLHETHLNILSSLKESGDDASESLVYSYTKSFNAFAAKLSEDEATKLSSMDEVVSVFRNRYHKLHTTRSWDFIDLTPKSLRNRKVESNIIVGLLDTGITPQSESFNDEGLGPPPAKWRGSCGKFANFSGCNNKLIGAKYFKLDKQPDPYDILSPIDVNGHGTHTSSTLAGSLVSKANVFGLAEGTARGAVPSARVAMYKVCWVSSGCSDMDILAGFDDAISDGVDIMSISLSGTLGLYTEDSIAIGAFHGSRKGILTVASAGNEGPLLGTVSNNAPWILTVGASGIDRQFRSDIVLGNGVTFSGIGVSTIEPKHKLYPLASGIDVAKNPHTKDYARNCETDSMDPQKVKGKIIFCKGGAWGSDAVIKDLGGVGSVVETEEYLDVANVFMAPSTMVNSTIGKIIDDYINSTNYDDCITPSAVIHKSKEVKVCAPFVASFSSRGPNLGSQSILKPDIMAPGIDIIASYSPLRSLTGRKGDTLYSKFNFKSGTSMACPHAGGVAAYVKSFHPDWSPAAIKSAIMTTATPMSTEVETDAEFASGSGHVNPTKAISPGLVYDMDDMSYIQFLCHEGYNGSSIGSLVGQGPINCSKLIPANGEDALNYPTMQLALKNNTNHLNVGVFHRRVTNVGPPGSIYRAAVKSPLGVEIVVKPMSLSFSQALQERSFKVVVKAKDPVPDNVLLLSGSLTWESSCYTVRSPIVIYNAWTIKDRKLQKEIL